MPAIDRTIQVLNAFTNGTSNLGVSELSRTLGINKSTLHGILNTLVHYHWLERDEMSKTYRLGFGLYALGNRAGAQLDLLAIAHPFVVQLAHEVQEIASGNLAVKIQPGNKDEIGQLISDVERMQSRSHVHPAFSFFGGLRTAGGAHADARAGRHD